MNTAVIGNLNITSAIKEAIAFEKTVKAVNDAAVTGQQAGDDLRKALIALDITSMEVPKEEVKKPQFFQRDIIPNKNRKFGKR